MFTVRSARSRVALVTGAALSLVALAACGSGTPADTPTTPAAATSGDSAAVQLLEPGTFKVCTHLSYKPFQFKDDSGKTVGFDVDIMDLVAKKLGATQEIVDIDFAQITSGAVFAAKKCDAGAAATTITDKRSESILFSDPYFEATQALMVKKDSGITSLDDLKGKRVGVQTDTTGQEYAKKNAAEKGYEIIVFDDMPTQLAGVLAGRADAAINDNGVVYDYSKENPQAEVVTEFDTGEQYGLMFMKDDANGTALAKVANEVLEEAKADGSYNDIYKKWFGVDAPK